MSAVLDIQTPRWSVPLLEPARYKGAYSGRSLGKSHFFAELMVEECVEDAYLPCVCIREVQKSLRFSAKRLIENKIKEYKLGRYFTILDTEIRRNRGDGIIIFQGMQDHTADSIKSLEGFMRAWVTEAQNLSFRSWQLLRPTIRAPGSEIWCDWNPSLPTDPVDQFFRTDHPDEEGVICVTGTYLDNPFITEEILYEAALDKKQSYETYTHVWLGGYNFKSDSQVLADKCIIEEFDIQEFGEPRKGPKYIPQGPFYGLDFGFSQDPTAAIRCWIWDKKLYIDYARAEKKLEISSTNDMICEIPGAERHEVTADNARPETINHLRKPWTDYQGKQRPGLNIKACDKWNGSIEDGIAYLRSFDAIVIHPRCKPLIEEVYNYRYKVDKMTEEILPVIVDSWNHCWDAVRYALNKFIKAFCGSQLDSWV